MDMLSSRNVKNGRMIGTHVERKFNENSRGTAHEPVPGGEMFPDVLPFVTVALFKHTLFLSDVLLPKLLGGICSSR